MTYYVIEMQSYAGQGAALVDTFQDEQHAREKYHLIMSAASVSNVPKHAAIILTEDLFKVIGEVAPRPQAGE